MRTVLAMEYVHRIEYRRRNQTGELTLAYVEIVEDHGWYIRNKGDWKTCYTLPCASDFLTRVTARAGTFAITVWRDTTRVCTVGLDWNPPIR